MKKHQKVKWTREFRDEEENVFRTQTEVGKIVGFWAAVNLGIHYNCCECGSVNHFSREVYRDTKNVVQYMILIDNGTKFGSLRFVDKKDVIPI